MQKLTQKLVFPGTREYKEIKALYNAAFHEIDDFDLMVQEAGPGRSALYGYYDGDDLAAFAFVLLPGHYCYVLYSALAEHLRHKGVIREIIAGLRAMYPDRPFIFDIETPDDAAPDREERRYRYEMFSHLGFSDTGFGMTDASGDYTIFSEAPFAEASFRESWDILPEEFGGTKIIALRKEE